MYEAKTNGLIVDYVGVFDAFSSVSGRREVRQLLRSILWVRYQIKDAEVFEKAYNYVEMYY